MAEGMNPVVPEYEVFKNERDALAFFFYKHPTLDGNPEEGPFWFAIRDDRIVASVEDILEERVTLRRKVARVPKAQVRDHRPVICRPYEGVLYAPEIARAVPVQHADRHYLGVRSR